MMTSATQMPSLLQEVVILHHEVIANGLQNGDGHGSVAGDGLDLLLAFLAAVTGQPLQSGDGHGQQLDDNGAVDIGLDAQGKHGGGGKGAAAHHVVKAQQAGAPDLHLQGQQRPG